MTTTITISEALQELKTIDKRIIAAKDFVLSYGIRQGSTIDPLDLEGGSHKVVPAKLDSLRDLLERKLAIRSAINAKNSMVNITIAKQTRTVADWIVWRREAFKIELESWQALQRKVLDARQQCLTKGMSLKEDGTQPSKVNEVGCFITEGTISSRINQLNEIESTLDGKLSVVNATTTITV
jgi:hypothetical protein